VIAPENSVLIPARSSSKANVTKLLIDEVYTLDPGVTEPKFTKCLHNVADHRRCTF